jgi:hypothetical protein
MMVRSPRDRRRPVAAPGEGRIDHPALQDERRAVALIAGKIVARFHPIAEDFRAPLQAPDDGFRVGIEQQLAWIETMAGFRLIRPVHPIAVAGAGTRIRQEAVPDLIGIFRQLHPADFLLAPLVEEAQLDLGGVGGEQGKVHAEPGPHGAEGVRFAFSNAQRRLGR